jgi:cell division protein FtsW
MHKKKLPPKKPHKGNIHLLFGLPILLTIIGLFFIFEASSVTTFRQIGDSFYYLRQQLIWFSIGVAIMIFFATFDYKKLYYFAFPAMLITVVFLVLVLIPGIGTTVSGARRWINVGSFGFQPSELAKFSVILYLSSWFLYKERKRFLSFLLLLGVIILLIMMQPNLGTTIIIACLFLAIYYLSGEKVKYLLGLIPVGLIGVGILIGTSPYRMKRLLAFMDPNTDPEGISYHIRQILISLSSGGVFGRGFANSRQKYQFLPEAHTDSIFAIIGEEVGFIGGLLLIGIYVWLLYQIYQVALHAKDRFGYLLVSSVLVLLSVQALINLGGMVNMIPLTGIPLPFISYGGSGLLVFYGLMGIVISVARR